MTETLLFLADPRDMAFVTTLTHYRRWNYLEPDRVLHF